MPTKGYKSEGKTSIPTEIIEAVDKLANDADFQREMRAKGFMHVSRALVVRIALLELLKSKGYDIGDASASSRKRQ